MNIDHYSEKLLFGLSYLASAGVSICAAILTTGETRWVYVTICVGILVSMSMALMTRRNDESMKVVVGRSLFAVICTVLGTRMLPHYFSSLDVIHDDILLLGAFSGLVNVVAFTVGYGFIRSLSDEKLRLGMWLKNILITILTKK